MPPQVSLPIASLAAGSFACWSGAAGAGSSSAVVPAASESKQQLPGECAIAHKFDTTNSCFRTCVFAASTYSKALKAFCDVSPLFLVPHAKFMQPYLKVLLRCLTGSILAASHAVSHGSPFQSYHREQDMRVLQSILPMLTETLPLIQQPQPAFLTQVLGGALEAFALSRRCMLMLRVALADVTKLITQNRLLALSIPCLCALDKLEASVLKVPCIRWCSPSVPCT